MIIAWNASNQRGKKGVIDEALIFPFDIKIDLLHCKMLINRNMFLIAVGCVRYLILIFRTWYHREQLTIWISSGEKNLNSKSIDMIFGIRISAAIDDSFTHSSNRWWWWINLCVRCKNMRRNGNTKSKSKHNWLTGWLASLWWVVDVFASLAHAHSYKQYFLLAFVSNVSLNHSSQLFLLLLMFTMWCWQRKTAALSLFFLPLSLQCTIRIPGWITFPIPNIIIILVAMIWILIFYVHKHSD